jgi:hypothetical protein
MKRILLVVCVLVVAAFSMPRNPASAQAGPTPVPSYLPAQPQYPAVPTPIVTTAPIGTVANNVVTIPLTAYNAGTEWCDIQGLDGTAVLSATLTPDNANSIPEPANVYYVSTTQPGYGTSITLNGSYAVSVGVAQFLNFNVVTSGATQNATFRCNSKPIDLPRAYDSNGNQQTTIAGQNIPIVSSTSPPAPTWTTPPTGGNGNNIMAMSPGCTSTPQTSNGYTSCHGDPATGNAFIDALNLKNSSTSGNPNTNGIFPDNPANAACNSSVAGYACNLALTTSTATTLITGVTSKADYVMGLTITNSSATTTLFSLVTSTSGTCNSTTIWGPQFIPAGSGLVLPVSIVPYVINPTIGGGICAKSSTSVSTLYVTAEIAQF